MIHKLTTIGWWSTKLQKHKIANFVILVLMKGRGYHWVTPCICRWQIFQVQFLSNEETIFAFLFRLKVQQSNYRCTKDLNGFAKNWTCCGKCKNLMFTFYGKQPICLIWRQNNTDTKWWTKFVMWAPNHH